MKINTKPFVLIGLVIFFYIIYRVGINNITNVFMSVNVYYLFISFLFPLPVIIIKSYRWKYIINLLKVKYPLLEASKIWLIGLSASTITPGHVGDFIKGFYLSKKTKISVVKSFSTIIIDRIFDVISLSAFALIGIFILLFMFEIGHSLSAVVFIAVILGALLLLSNKKIIKVLLTPLYKLLIPRKYKSKFKKSFNDFYYGMSVIGKRKHLSIILLISITSWLLSITQAYFIFKAFNTEVPILFLVSVLPIEILVTLIPITISGFGTRELTLIFFFTLIGISPSIVVAFSLLSVFIVWVTVAIGFLFWLKNPIDIRI